MYSLRVTITQIKIKNIITSESSLLTLYPAPRGIHDADFCEHRLGLSVLELHINGLTLYVLFFHLVSLA